MADDTDTRVKIALALEVIDDPKSAPGTTVIDAIAALSSVRPTLVIDLTDPPTPPRYVLGKVEATGPDADSAAAALGAALRPHFADLSRAAVLPAVVDIAAIADAAVAVDQAAAADLAQAPAGKAG